MKIVGEPSNQWRVTLKSGKVLGLIADAYGEVNGHYVFEVLVSAPEEEQALDRVIVTATTPSDPERVMIAVAAIPVDEVQDVSTGSWSDVVPAIAPAQS